MTKTREWPVRAMYMLIAAALAISLIITAAPAHRVSAASNDVVSEWDRVSTPTTDGAVLAPGSIIWDYALAENGDVDYAIVEGTLLKDDEPVYGNWLFKSEDAAATWEDITKGVKKEISKVLDLDSDEDVTPDMFQMLQVATDGEAPDFVALALNVVGGSIHVFISTDGGDTFEDTGEVKDGVYFSDPADVSYLAVSYENADGDRDIAIGGMDNSGRSALFRCTVKGGDSPGAWKDATDYDGWDDDGDFTSDLVTQFTFSPNWATDKTILVTTVDVYYWYEGYVYGTVHLQCGSWGTSPGWNEKSTLGIEAVPIKEDIDIPMWLWTGIAGITVPEDYNSKNTDDRVLWVWVNYYNTYPVPACEIIRVDDDSADPVGPMGQIEDGELWLTNISYQGTIAEGKAIAGVIGDGIGEYTECCTGVQVYRNDGIRNMDICCERWHDACKPPTGRWVMAVDYVSEDKAYAVALLDFADYDEGAWSWSFDDGDTWNQLSLIDTNIDYFSDVAVSPDCNKTMLVSVNVEDEGDDQTCYCDSVWLYAENLPEDEGPEYSGKWLRTWCGQLDGDWGLLRLAPEETTGDNVYLVDYDTSNVYWNDMETLACWDPIGSTAVDHIVELAARDADTLYALDANGDVAMFDDDEWHEAVDSEVDVGYTIAVWGDDIIVGGEDSDVSHSDDGGETFTALEDVATIAGYVTVAFDSYFDTNNTIYAALEDAGDDNGVYRWIIGESEEWKDLEAEPLESQIGISDADTVDEDVEVNFTGLVLDRPNPGNPMTSADTGGVLYASYYGSWYGHDFTGVARYLTPAEDVVCKECGDWDYLIEGLTIDVEGFVAWPDALKICGCLDATTNSKLFAIDSWNDYDREDGEDGAVWMFEDCYAKKAPEITSPADGYVVPANPCACDNIPFTISWGRLCDACSYDIEFALDEEFTSLVSDACEYDYTPSEGEAPAYQVPSVLTCEFTYYYRIRAIEAGTGQVIRSWWTTPVRSVTIAPSTGAGIIDLISPEPGATDVAIKNVGFSWDLTATADAFDWVLDDNYDLSSPVESKTALTTKAYGCTQTLSYNTTYYWQVIAYREGAAISTSAVGTFRTMEQPTGPVTPVTPETPTWVWVVIAIGAVLVIVVIVLIFRTRRV